MSTDQKLRLVPVAIAAGAVLVWVVSPWFGSIAGKTAGGWAAFWTNDWFTYLPFTKWVFVFFLVMVGLALLGAVIGMFDKAAVAKRKSEWDKKHREEYPDL